MKQLELTTAAAGGDADSADGVGPQQVHLPPRRRLPQRLGAASAVVHRGAVAVVGVTGRAAAHRRRLIGWPSQRHVRPCNTTTHSL